MSRAKTLFDVLEMIKSFYGTDQIELEDIRNTALFAFDWKIDNEQAMQVQQALQNWDARVEHGEGECNFYAKLAEKEANTLYLMDLPTGHVKSKDEWEAAEIDKETKEALLHVLPVLDNEPDKVNEPPRWESVYACLDRYFDERDRRGRCYNPTHKHYQYAAPTGGMHP